VKLLLDTHALLWWLGDDPRLGKGGRALIEDAANEVLVSHASLWEIAIKIGIGKLRLDVMEMAAAIDARGLTRLGLADPHLAVLASLERRHGDPFDHMLIAQAIAEGATLMTDDAQIRGYTVRTVTCR